MSDETFILRCLEIANEYRGRVGNGACVGAVLVRGGSAIAEGVHRGFGLFHAERDLLLNFKGKIKPDDTLYVNLEPCCPSPTKKTPPCTDIIIERGVKRLVYGMTDPDTRVSGKGIAILQEAGVSVEGPVASELCARFNRGFVSLRTKGIPWILLQPQESSADLGQVDALLTEDTAAKVPEGRTLFVCRGDEITGGGRLLFRKPRTAHDARELLEKLGTPVAGFNGISSVAITGSRTFLNLFSDFQDT